MSARHCLSDDVRPDLRLGICVLNSYGMRVAVGIGVPFLCAALSSHRATPSQRLLAQRPLTQCTFLRVARRIRVARRSALLIALPLVLLLPLCRAR